MIKGLVIGFQNLTKLSSKSYLDVKENSEPHCLLKDLFEYSKDLIVLSGGIDSLFSKLIQMNKTKNFSSFFSFVRLKFTNHMNF